MSLDRSGGPLHRWRPQLDIFINEQIDLTRVKKNERERERERERGRKILRESERERDRQTDSNEGWTTKGTR